VTARTPLLLLLSGPAGSGKTTLGQNLLAAEPGLHRVVTATTREPRPGERDGEDYHFLSPDAFHALRERGGFLETATVHGRSYGTPEAEVRAALAGGHDALLIIDVQGMRQVRAAAPGKDWLRGRVVTVFLAPPDPEELRRRLQERGTDDPAEVERRLETARAERAAAPEFDHVRTSGSREEDLQWMRSLLAALHREAREAREA
jgi:guanylate kinase